MTSYQVYAKSGNFTDELTTEAITFNIDSDHFQKHAYHGINNEMAILTSAPTGSGKTRIIHYAIAYYLAQQKTVAVTTPIKALSNQKYQELVVDFSKQYKDKYNIDINVGLLTADININPDADVIIMTTEMLNNSLNNYNNIEKQKKLKPTFIEKLGCAIFDEAHYFNDEDRGNVWESILIKLQKHINVVLVSATFPNMNEYAHWLAEVRQRDICLVEETKRIVPLIHHVFIDTDLRTIITNNNFDSNTYNQVMTDYNKIKKKRELAHKSYANINLIDKVINKMKEMNILQTLFFVFSKRKCEEFASHVVQGLLTHDEISEMEKIFESLFKKHKHTFETNNQYQFIRLLLRKGVCFHHAEVIPILKEIIEILFAKKLIKVLFVTETMAAGLNMPAKTVVFTGLKKRTDKNVRNLLPYEYIQMAGRAGRRGLDTVGHVIILPIYDLLPTNELYSMVNGRMDNISSKMKIDYSLLLKTLTCNNFTEFINNSFYKLDQDKKLNSMMLTIHEEEKKEELLKINLVDNPDFDKLYEIDKQQDHFSHIGLKYMLNKKQHKLVNGIRNKMKGDVKLTSEYENFKQHRKLQHHIISLQNDYQRTNNHVINISSKLLNILCDMKFVSKDNSEYSITLMGTIAAQINECNPLILAKLILYDKDCEDDSDNMLYGLSACELVSLFSMFVESSNHDNEISLTEIDGTNNIKNRITKVNNIINNLKQIESDHYLESDDNYWNITYDYIDPVLMWANGSSFSEVMQQYSAERMIGDGGFIKLMLKLSNIINDIKSLCIVVGNLKPLPELEKIEQLLIRNEVSKDSLYVEQV